MTRKNKSAERTSMQHAERILRDSGWIWHKVQKMRAITGPPGQPMYRNLGEDLFGVFDIIAVQGKRAPLFIQVTTFGDTTRNNNATARMRKIRDWVHLELWGSPPEAYLQVWAWEKRTKMHRWNYQAHLDEGSKSVTSWEWAPGWVKLDDLPIGQPIGPAMLPETNPLRS